MVKFKATHIRFWENVPSCPVETFPNDLSFTHNPKESEVGFRTRPYVIRFVLNVPERGRLPILAHIDPRHIHRRVSGARGIVWNGRLAVDCSLAYRLSAPYWQFTAVFDDKRRLCEITMSDEMVVGFLDRAFEHYKTCGFCHQQLKGLDFEAGSCGA